MSELHILLRQTLAVPFKHVYVVCRRARAALRTASREKPPESTGEDASSASSTDLVLTMEVRNVEHLAD